MITLDHESAVLLAQVLPTLLIALAIEGTGQLWRQPKAVQVFMRWMRFVAVTSSSMATFFCIVAATEDSERPVDAYTNWVTTIAVWSVGLFMISWATNITLPFGKERPAE